MNLVCFTSLFAAVNLVFFLIPQVLQRLVLCSVTLSRFLTWLWHSSSYGGRTEFWDGGAVADADLITLWASDAGCTAVVFYGSACFLAIIGAEHTRTPSANRRFCSNTMCRKTNIDSCSLTLQVWSGFRRSSVAFLTLSHLINSQCCNKNPNIKSQAAAEPAEGTVSTHGHPEGECPLTRRFTLLILRH